MKQVIEFSTKDISGTYSMQDIPLLILQGIVTAPLEASESEHGEMGAENATRSKSNVNSPEDIRLAQSVAPGGLQFLFSAQAMPQINVNAEQNALTGSVLAPQIMPKGINASQERNKRDVVFLFSRGHLDVIRAYVKTGKTVAEYSNDTERLMSFLGYRDTAYQSLHPNSLVKVFTNIAKHCNSWADVESLLPKLGFSFGAFADRVINNGNRISEYIGQMPIMERIENLGTISDHCLPFEKSDYDILKPICQLMRELSEEVRYHQKNAQTTSQCMADFRYAMDNTITPMVSSTIAAYNALPNLEMARTITWTERCGFLNLKTIKHQFSCSASIEKGKLLEKEMSSSLDLFRNTNSPDVCKDILDQIFNRCNTALTRLNESLAPLDSNAIIMEADIGIKNLETVWNVMGKYIDDSETTLHNMDNSQSLILFKTHMASIVSSWQTVKESSAQLSQIFQ